MKKKVQISRTKLEEMRSFLDELPENQETTLTAAQTIAELRRNIEKAKKKGWSKEQISEKLKAKFQIDISPSYFNVALREKKTRGAAANKDAASEPAASSPTDKPATGEQDATATKKG